MPMSRNAPPTGTALLSDPLRNRGRAFTPEERKSSMLVGLLPAGDALTRAQQVELVIEGVRRRAGAELAQYEFLLQVLHDDASLLFLAIEQHTSELVPIVCVECSGSGARAS